MPKFAYRGIDREGTEQRGEIEAPGLTDAAAQLRGRVLQITSLDRSDPQKPAPLPEDADAFAVFNRCLAEMTSLGFPLPRAVREIARGMPRGRFKKALGRLEALLREGASFEQALAQLPDEFPPYYRWMVKAGASSGNLPGILSAVARNREGHRRARRALAGALAYPALVAFFALALAAGLVFYFVPLYHELHRLYGIRMTPAMNSILGILDSREAQIRGVAGVAAVVVAFALWLRRTVSGERFLLRLPILGRIRRHLLVARLLGTLGALLRAQAPLTDALPVALGASGSLELERRAEALRAKAAEGATLGEILRQIDAVPPAITAYLDLAGRTGRLAAACDELADFSTERAVSESDTLSLILFPAALAVTGAFIAVLCFVLVAPYARFIGTLR